jgi:hypothetical protein
MNATLNYVAKFKEHVEQASSKNLGEPADIIETISKVKAINPPTYESERVAKFLADRTKALDKLINSYFVSVFSRNYPHISSDMFKLKRYFHYKDGAFTHDTTNKPDGTFPFEAPLFCFSPLTGDRKTQIGSWTTNGSKVTISATLPPPPDKIMQCSKKVLATYHKVMSEICDEPILSDLFTLEETVPYIGALWIPVEKCLSVKVSPIEMPPSSNYDPALVLKVLNEWYLAATWEIEEEHSFDHYLREFSIGNLKKKD